MSIKKFLLAIAIASHLTACGTSHSEDASSPKNLGRDDASGKKSEADALPKKPQLTTVENTIPSDWVRISANGFSFSVPPDMAKRDVQGTDSYVGSYRNGNFDINFDYGMYTKSAENADELIDGKKAKITDEDHDYDIDGAHYKKYSGVNFEDIGRPGVNLSMYIYGKTSDDQATARIIFRSIRLD